MKKSIVVTIVILVALAAGYLLYKMSPEQTAVTQSSYNASLNTDVKNQLSEPPAFDPNIDHYVGDPKAKNVFIEYGDMQCPACAAYAPIFKQVNTAFPDTVFVFRYFPLVQIHPNSVESAMAVEAAGAQGKYWEMHELLFQKQVEWEALTNPLDKFAEYAQSLGVSNVDQFKSDITDKKYLPKIQTDSDEALGMNLSGTPSVFFNNHALVVKGNTIDYFKQAADPFFVK